MKKANEKNRHDPIINEKVRQVIIERNKKLEQVQKLAAELVEALKDYPYSYSDDPAARIYQSAAGTAWLANLDLQRIQPSNPDNETYVGNLSAFELGSYFSDVTEKD